MEYPSLIQIETAQFCNASCAFCPYSTMARDPKARMPLELFDHLLEDIASWERPLPRLLPFLTNEPFADPRMPDLCRRINERLPAIQIDFFTNGSLFTPRLLERLEGITNLGEIFVSLHHSSAPEYEAEIGIPWEKTLASVDRLLQWNVRSEVVGKVRLMRVRDGDSETDRRFEAFCAERFPGVEAGLGYRLNWKGDIASPWEYEPTLDIICPRHTGMTILADGRVALCCLDQNGEYCLGDAKEQSLLEIYNGPKALAYRTRTKRHSEPCNRCNMGKGLPPVSETARYHHLTAGFCQGNGLDIGSGGDPVVPTAIQVELASDRRRAYGSPEAAASAHLQGDGTGLSWFIDNCLDYVYSSHLLEDFEEWEPVLREWMRVVRPFGYLVLLIPDRERFRAAVASGQPDNPNHRHEGRVGELSEHVERIGGWKVLEDRLADEHGYTILFVARKLRRSRSS